MSSSNGRVQPQHVEGVVEAVNANGLKIAGAWLNVSRFKPIALPEKGAHVRLEVDGRGYLASLDVLSPAGDLPAGRFTTVNRDDRIARLAVLKAAAHFAAARTDIKSSDVLRIADAWLAWVER